MRHGAKSDRERARTTYRRCGTCGKAFTAYSWRYSPGTAKCPECGAKAAAATRPPDDAEGAKGER